MEETAIKGKYSLSTKLNEFIGGKGHVNFLAKSATISAKSLSGMYFEDFKLKLTIYDDGSVDFDEIDTEFTNEDERKRLLSVIEEMSLGLFRNRTVINELEFTSIEKVKGKNIPLYLAVEYQKPIDKLGSLLNDEVEISEDAMDNLNDLLNSWFEDEEFTKMVEEMVEEENSQVIEDVKGVIDDTFMQHDDTVPSQLQLSFSKMKEEKLQELTTNQRKVEDEIRKHSFQLETSKKLLQDAESALKLLEDRIQDLKPPMVNNGIYFSVSERQNEEVILDTETEELIRKTVSKVKSINTENFMNLFKEGEFHIYLSTKNDDDFTKVTELDGLGEEVLENLSKMELVFDEGKFIYSGELKWGDIVNKMVKMGFQQDSDFDEICFPKSEVSENANSKSSKF